MIQRRTCKFQTTAERYSKCQKEIFQENQMFRRYGMACILIIAIYCHSRVLIGFIDITDLEPKVDTGKDDEYREQDNHIHFGLQESGHFREGHFHFFESRHGEIVIYEPVTCRYILGYIIYITSEDKNLPLLN